MDRQTKREETQLTQTQQLPTEVGGERRRGTANPGGTGAKPRPRLPETEEEQTAGGWRWRNSEVSAESSMPDLGLSRGGGGRPRSEAKQ